MSLNPHFKPRNLVAYNFAGFACISLAVFLSSSQPFYLSDVIGISPHKIGHAIGSLTIVDELTAIAVAPLLGTLVDWINGNAWKNPRLGSGPRVSELAAFLVVGISFLGYGLVAKRTFPELYFFRALFAVGMSGVMSVAVVMLHEANNSDFEWTQLRFWRKNGPESYSRLYAGNDHEEVSEIDSSATSSEKNGKLSALLGICTGLGAIFSVSFFLTLPIRLSEWNPAWSTRLCLQTTYCILGAVAMVCGLIVYWLGYDCIQRRREAGRSPNADMPEHSYWKLMADAIQVSKNSKKLQLAYTGGFVARAATVTSSMFIPLMVYQYYTKNGLCGTADKPTATGNCYNAYIFSAILTGVSSTVSLLLTPIWGILIDSKKYGCGKALLYSGVLGSFGSFVLCILGSGSEVYDPRNFGCFLTVCCMGTAQIGVVISSMSLVSRAGKALQEEHRVIGSITGLYSLSGGVGILLVAKVGGAWSDRWVFGPFLVLGVLYSVLACAASLMERRSVHAVSV